MYPFFILLQVIICIGLIFLVLIQSGKGKGLVDSFSSADSVFGTKTNTFLVKATTVLAIAFFFNCLLLAFLTIQANKSKMTSFAPDSSKASKMKQETSKVLKEIKEQEKVTEANQAQQQSTATSQVSQESTQQQNQNTQESTQNVDTAQQTQTAQ